MKPLAVYQAFNHFLKAIRLPCVIENVQHKVIARAEYFRPTMQNVKIRFLVMTGFLQR